MEFEAGLLDDGPNFGDGSADDCVGLLLELDPALDAEKSVVEAVTVISTASISARNA